MQSGRQGKRRRVTRVTEVDRPGAIAAALFIEAVVDEGLTSTELRQITCSASCDEDFGRLGRIEYHRRFGDWAQTLIRASEGALVLVALGGSSADVQVAARSHETLAEVWDRVAEVLVAVEQPEDRVPISFWAADGDRQGVSSHLHVCAPAWDELSDNHSPACPAALGPLMAARQPDEGRLLLWHGPLGTGKTHAVKALLGSWRGWCAPHFISDPEVFLGASTSYLTQVLTRGDPDPRLSRDWRLVILEDSGELLSADARNRTGQALSRLLNLTDGLLGQSMNALVLVTTNEPVGKLHPAVTRAGRCWAEVEFEPLAVGDANRWLRENGSCAEVGAATAIADLYAVLAGRTASRSGGRFGFAA